MFGVNKKVLTSNFFFKVDIAFLFISCEVISEDRSDDLIARAGGNFLYQNELPSFSSLEDSLIRYTSYIESWAKEKILYDLSLTNLSQTKKIRKFILSNESFSTDNGQLTPTLKTRRHVIATRYKDEINNLYKKSFF